MSVAYVVCAAGEGSRFRKDFGNLPKSLIKLCGHTLIEWSLKSLPIYADDKLIFITQTKHRLKEKCFSLIKSIYPFNSIEWIEIPALTRGQLETASLAKPYVGKDDSLVIYNCDTYFQSKSLSILFNDPNVDGAIPCAEAEGNAWSFCRTDDNGNIVEVKEKVRISPWATVGLYYFRDSQLFFKLADECLNKPTNDKEYFVAPLYQWYIDHGKNIAMDKVSLFKPMGTPEQIEEFWNIKIAKVKAENLRPVLVIDLDNTITIDEPGTPYPEKKANQAVINKMKAFKKAGWEIIILSSRQMESRNNDESKVLANIGEITFAWLRKHNVPFDGLKFGKPYARRGFYVDDKGIRPDEFVNMDPFNSKII